MSDPKPTKTYTVWGVARCVVSFQVEAVSEQEALEMVRANPGKGDIFPPEIDFENSEFTWLGDPDVEEF